MMMNRWKSWLFALLASGFSMQAGAALVDLGTTTKDTNTGLVWLDLSQTVGMSYQQVLTEIGPGGSLLGYRVATLSELDTLFSSYGLAASGNADLWNLWGQAPDTILVTMFYDDPNIDELASGSAAYGLIDQGGATATAQGTASIYQSNSFRATALVQTVPIPAALPLFLSGLLLIGGQAVRRRNS